MRALTVGGPEHRRRREESVIAREPGGRIPWVAGVLENGESLDHLPTSARPEACQPGRRLPEGRFLSVVACRVDHGPAEDRRQIGIHPGAEEGVIGFADRNVFQGFQRNLEIDLPERVRGSADHDPARIAERLRGIRPLPVAGVRDDDLLARGHLQRCAVGSDLTAVQPLLPVVASIHLVATEEDRAVMGKITVSHGGHRCVRWPVHREEKGILFICRKPVAGEELAADRHVNA